MGTHCDRMEKNRCNMNKYSLSFLLDSYTRILNESSQEVTPMELEGVTPELMGI